MSKLSSEKRNRLNDSDFGIPEKRMYPLHDKAHIESAVRLFGHAENKYKRSLARKILSRAREYNMDTSGWKQVLSFAQEQVPPMSNGTSIGNAPPRMMAPYYDEQDELLQRANSMDPNSKETMFDKAKRIVTIIHNKTEQDSKPPTGNQNCQLCTWCAEAQFRGINALPRPIYSPRDPALEIKGENIVLRPIRRYFTSQRDVVETVRGAVDSRWYVHVNWAESTGGHEFLVVNLNDYAYIMDAQAGLLKEIDETDSSHNYFRNINFRNSYMVRLDDKEFNRKLFNEMNDPSKVLPWNPELDVPYMKEQGMLSDMSNKWTMRPATKADLEFVYFSELETVGENKHDPKVQKYIREDAKESLGHTQIIVAEDSDIGVYQAYATDYYGLRESKKDWWYLAHIYIKPEYRTLGIGSAIIKRDIAEHDKILLQVMKSNPRAKKLYESLGFVVTQENDHGGLIMRLDKTKPIQESFIDEYAKRVNDKGDPVPEKCKCGGKVSAYLRGEPVYLCEVCGKYYGTLPCNIQESFISGHMSNHKWPDFKSMKTDHLKKWPHGDADDWEIDNDDGTFTTRLDTEVGIWLTRVFKYWAMVPDFAWDIKELMDFDFDPYNEVDENDWPLDISWPGIINDLLRETVRAASATVWLVEDFDLLPEDRQKIHEGYNKFDHKEFIENMTDVGNLAEQMLDSPILHIKNLNHELTPEDKKQLDDIRDVGKLFIDIVYEWVMKYKSEGIKKMYLRMMKSYDRRNQPKKTTTVQEGAFQDLKNGVNPYSDNLVFHVTPDKHVDGQVWKPRVPDYLDPYNPEDTGFEDNTTPRICFSTSIEGCLNGITVNLQRQSPDTFDKMYVYVPEKPWKEYKHKTNKQLVKDKLVYDANVTREVWIMEPVRMKLYGVIRVDQIADAKRKSVVPTSKGQKDTRNYFTYKWHWVVKPKVLKKATKFDYSPERVIDDLCIDIKKFKYGLIKDGRLMTGNVSDADYNKYWVFHSGETVDQAGGGNCYDMVEYEAGYLEAFGVPYKKYFMNFTDTKNTKTINTHTICVVPHNGKFIYIEQAFKRVVDEWGYERKKVFDKLNDIFEYVAEVTAEYENQDLNYGVWDYTNAEIDYGTPIKNFMEWIFNNCTMIHDGEATKSKPIKEGFELNDYDDDTILECDMFVELGDSMFYVSEYHNALFDDPDAHDEAINEFGILLDSYNDEIVQEAAYGPYDEYLKRHNYDPKTNSIEDPNNPGRRVNAGRIGSNKERNRMNKFLRENGYDPKTETILTDINDKNNPGQKKRVKFGINSAIGNAGAKMTMPPAYSRVDNADDYTDDTGSGIAMSKSTMQQKPGQSNYILKHEEGHMAYEDSFDKKRDGTWNMNPSHHSPKAYRDDINAARQHIKSQAKKNPALLGNAHDILPTEYQADKYGEEHNRYGRGHGATALSNLIGKLKKFDPSTYRAKRDAMLDSYGTGEEGFKKFAATLQDEYDTMLDMSEAMKGTPSASAYKKGLISIKREIDAGFPESRKVFFSLTQPDEKKAIDEGIQRDIDMVDAGTNSRAAFMKKYADKAKVQQAATAAKQRQLAKEQLKQQISSGKLTGDQAAKAERKIQRIEAFEKQQAQNQPIPKTKPVKPQTTNATPPPTSTSSSDKPLSVQNQSLTTPPKQEQKPTIKKEGYKLNRFKSRFFQEEEELSDTEDMEDITIGDLNLDDNDGDDEEKEEKEEKISISDEELEDGGDASTEKEDDEELSDDMELPGYMKERMSEDDVESFEQPDENLNADNVDLGQFGKDQSDVQNDYDQKEIDILMKLMASEADAMNEYMDGAKETNVDVLRRLYADIANEERFHMEQLLFAKSELTGEKYQPKDPEVKSEYEELLKMGMDEETAMQTAVDRCHIRGSITEDDGEKMVEIQQDVETMEMAISMFNAQFDNVLMMMESKSFKKEDVEHAVDVFVEACCVQEEVYNVNTDNNKGGYLNQGKASANPIDLLRKGLGFIIRVLRTLITKFVEFLKRVRNHSRAIRTYIKRYGIEGIFASSKETTKMYFIDLDAPACINDSAETLLALTVDTYNACARSAGFQQQLPIGNLKRDSRFNIGGNIDKGIQILNGVQLIKTKMVIPKDKQKQEEIAACLFGYNEQRVTDSGESYNTLNRLKVMSDKWSAVLNGVNKQLEQMNTLRTQQGSIYYNNRKKYDLVIKGFETIIKTGKGVVTALQNDMNAIMKLNNEAMDISIQKTQQQDQDRMDKTPQLKQWNQNYKQNVDKGLK